jgi:Txe/YoeB family toxin of Txe-Axe toxin-antitoxin module
MGKIEPILEDRPQTYRSLVINHINKVVYRAEDDRIVVVAIWDCRRAPETLAGQID